MSVNNRGWGIGGITSDGWGYGGEIPPIYHPPTLGYDDARMSLLEKLTNQIITKLYSRVLGTRDELDKVLSDTEKLSSSEEQVETRLLSLEARVNNLLLRRKNTLLYQL